MKELKSEKEASSGKGQKQESVCAGKAGMTMAP